MLELKQIVKDYPAGSATVHALKGIDLRFRTSEFVSILGPSGCGKTTLLNIIGGLDQYTSGDLVIDGVSTKDYKDRDWDTYRNHSIGFVFQTYNLIPHQTVLANVELALTLAGVPKAERRERAAKALDRVGLGDQLNKRPNQMSGGQMQRVAIARALVNNPDIILADEPTGALDTETGIQVMELLKEVAQDRLVVMVTHNPELAEQYSSRIIRILDGVIVGDTAPLSEEEYQAEKKSELDKMETDSEAVAEATTSKTPNATTQEAIDGKKESTAEIAQKSTKKDLGKKKHKKKKSSMSFWTAFKLSLTNLFTKKGRTFLTSFAGSIGIIGIALILSVSQGMTAYINQVEEQTLTTYPITIESTAMDLSSLVSSMMDTDEGKVSHDKDTVYQRSIAYNVAKMIEATAHTQNDLKTFKAWLEKEVQKDGSKLHDAIAGLQYQYNLDLEVYTKNPSGAIQKADPQELIQKIIARIMTPDKAQSAMGGYYTSMSNFSFSVWQELLPAIDEKNAENKYVNNLLYNQYDLIQGAWPKNYDEIVLVVNENNEISDIALYTLGLIGDDYVDSIVDSFEPDGTFTQNNAHWSFDEICGTECRVILNSSCYFKTKDKWIDLRDYDGQLETLYNNALKLKITGIIRPNPDATAHMLNGTIGYTSALTQYVVEQARESDIVKEQLANETIDIFTGLPFGETTKDMTDAEKATDFREYFAKLNNTEKLDVYTEMLSLDNPNDVQKLADEQMAPFVSNPQLLRQFMAQMMASQYEGVTVDDMMGVLSLATDEQLFAMAAPAFYEMGKAKYKESKKTELLALGEETYLQQINDYLQDVARTDEQFAAYYDSVIKPKEFSDATYEGNLAKMGYVFLDNPKAIHIYAASFDAKDVIAKEIARYNSEHTEEQQITYTDFVALVMSAVTQIINAVTYVLIAFVAISLIVSSIMIGVITLISVQERTKEIGILRAIGASKRDVSSMFNAETVIIGFAAGLIGVVFTYLLCIPINLILHALTGISTLSAYLPPVAALILIAISVGLTLISGLIPSRSAAKKDPVVALRTE